MNIASDIISLVWRLTLVAGLVSLWGLAPATAQEALCEDKPAPKISPYKGVYFANDFSYLDDPCLSRNDPRDSFSRFVDQWKRVKVGSSIVVEFGGEYRIRYHDENNHAKTKLNGADNDFTLSRLRLYMNTKIGKSVRIYAEVVDAASVGEDLPPRGIEVNRWDVLNAFVEYRTGGPDGKIMLRVGRQELMYGAQRFISPLDWSNIRRSFDAVRVDYENSDFSVSGFYGNLRKVRAHRKDGTDGSLTFAGLYGTYKGWAGQTVETYILRLEETAGAAANFELFTLGSRLKGGKANLMWEAEGAYQWGSFGALDQRAAMFSAALGYKLGNALPFKPVVWAYYDWASGDSDPTNGKRGTFHQHFPLGHAYLGFMDLVGRQNIQDLSARLITKPHAKVTLILTGHSFSLVERLDGLYNAGGGRIRFDPTGAAGTDVGEEFDIVVKFALMQRAELMLGYSKFWGGSFIDATNPVGVSGNASFFYSQFSIKF